MSRKVADLEEWTTMIEVEALDLREKNKLLEAVMKEMQQSVMDLKEGNAANDLKLKECLEASESERKKLEGQLVDRKSVV